MEIVVLPYLRSGNAEIGFSFSKGDHERRKYEVKKGKERKEKKTRETERSSETLCILLWYIFGKKHERHAFVVSEFAAASRLLGGTRWRSWLMHCATSRKVAGSIPDCVIGIFH